MLGLMMDRPLTIASLARHAERNHGQREVVSVTADHERHRYRFADCFARAHAGAICSVTAVNVTSKKIHSSSA